MSDPRNVAHNKKVKQEKAHQEKAGGAGATPKKKKQGAQGGSSSGAEDPSEQATPPPSSAVDYEKSQAVLSKLKDLEFHSRANIETLAGLILTIEEELKQKEFSGAIGDIYAAQDGFHTKIAELIESYEKKMESLRPST